MKTLKVFLVGIFGYSIFAFAHPALAVTITVGTQDYEVVGNNTDNFFTLETSLRDQVWWGDPSLAEEFSTNYGAATGNPGVSSYFIFGYDFDDGGTTSVNDDSVISYATQFGNSVGPLNFSAVTGGGTFNWMTATAVPEINGSILARLTLILGAAYLGLVALRRRASALPSAI